MIGISVAHCHMANGIIIIVWNTIYFCVSAIFCYYIITSRIAIVIRTHDVPKNPYIPLF